MNDSGVLKKGFITRLILLILLVCIVFSSVSGLFLYFNTYSSLDTSYSASISIISDIKEDLLARTLTIGAVFYLFILIGIMSLTVLYTHRIAGPLQRIKLFAGTVTGGDLRSALKFRKKDAIHSFGDSLNRMTDSWRGSVQALTSYTEQLEAAVSELRSLSENKKDTSDVLKKISTIDKEIKKILKEMKQ